MTFFEANNAEELKVQRDEQGNTEEQRWHEMKMVVYFRPSRRIVVIVVLVV